MTTTPIMGITLPNPLITTGPTWAADLNTAFGVLDGHDHVNTGTKITSAALDINSDLDFKQNSISEVYSIELHDLGSTETGNNLVYAVNGLLYFNSGSGVPIQLTTLSGINIASVGTIGGDYGQVGVTASASYSDSTKTFSWTQDTGIPAKMFNGSVSIAFESAGENAVTRSAQTGSAAYTIKYPVAAPALNSMEVFDASGVGTFKVITGTTNQVTVTFSAGAVTLALPQNIHTGASPTFVGATFSGLTASQVVVTNGSKALASLQYTNTNVVSTIVSRDGSGNFSAGVGSFSGLNVSGLTASNVVVTDGSKNLASVAYASANTASAIVQRDGSGNFSAGTLSIAGANISGLTASRAVVTDGSKNLASIQYTSSNVASSIVQRDSAGTVNFTDVGLSGKLTATDGIITNTGAPQIKTKKVTGTTTSGVCTVSHGITSGMTKILSVTGKLQNASTNYFSIPNDGIRVFWTDSTVTASDVAGTWPNGSAVVFFIIYEV